MFESGLWHWRYHNGRTSKADVWLSWQVREKGGLGVGRCALQTVQLHNAVSRKAVPIPKVVIQHAKQIMQEMSTYKPSAVALDPCLWSGSSDAYLRWALKSPRERVNPASSNPDEHVTAASGNVQQPWMWRL